MLPTSDSLSVYLGPILMLTFDMSGRCNEPSYRFHDARPDLAVKRWLVAVPQAC